MARRSNRRQFVWARAMGVIGSGTPDAVLAEDLLAGVRDRHGAGVLRGATVMGIRGYIRPSFGVAQVLNRVRVGIRVFNALTPTDRAEGPVLDPEADWMHFHQFLVPTSIEASQYGSSSRGTEFSVDSQAARKLEELGQSLAIYADGLNADFTVSNVVSVDYDLSVGLKLP